MLYHPFLCGLAEILQPCILEASCSMTRILVQVVVTIMSFEVM